jgi:hypothetical protein
MLLDEVTKQRVIDAETGQQPRCDPHAVPPRSSATAPQLYQRAPRVPDLAQALRGDLEVLFRATAAFRCRIADAGGDQGLGFEAFEGGVNTAEQDTFAAGRLQLARDWHAVRVFADAEDGQQDHQLEAAEPLATHLVNLID